MAPKILHCENLTLRNADKILLDAVSFSLCEGEIVGLLGAEGSGKTSLLKTIAGLLLPSEGEILIDGLSPSPATVASIAYLPDCRHLPDRLTTTELVRLFSTMFADFDAERAKAHLHALRVNTEKRFSALSRGTQEKIRLILTMSRRARLYLLDEPFGSSDSATRDYLIQIILASKSDDSALLLATSDGAPWEDMLDSLLLLSEGRLTSVNHTAENRTEDAATLDAPQKGGKPC